MRKLQRCIAFLLVCIMASSFMPAMAFNIAEDVKGTKYEESAYVLGALGIMVGDAGTGNFRPEDSITRAEFAKIAVVMTGLSDAASSSNSISKFPDVAVDHWANGYINIASSQKLVIGRTDGTFDPESKITYQEAMTILVRALGYEPAALSKGGYPAGYLAVGVETGISKNAVSAYEEPVKRGIVANMANNALTVKLMEQTGFGSNVKYEIVDKTILKDKLNVEKGEGQITANGFSTLDSDSGLSKEEVIINNETFKIGNSNADTLLGYYVDYYAKIEDDNTKTIILAIADSSKKQAVTVEGENIESINATEFKYWVDKEKDSRPESIKLADKLYMIYNGVGMDLDLSVIKNTLAGTVKFVETTGDQKYDVIFIDELTNIVVEDVIEGSYKIIDKYGNDSLTVDPSDDTYHFTMVDKNLNTVEFKDLKEWNVLSYTVSKDNKLIRIIVSNDFAEGKITEMSEDKFTINGKEYQVADNYKTPLKLLDEGIFYLDAFGKIAAVEKKSNTDSAYAYLISAGTTGSVDVISNFKVLTSDGKISTITAEEKIKFNGKSGTYSKDVVDEVKQDGKTVSQLIKIKTNTSGKISEIETYEDKTSGSLYIDEYDFINNFKGNDVVFKANSSKLGQFNITDETIVFDIPENSNDPDDYTVRDKKMFENDSKYNVLVFDVTEDMTAKAVIVTNSDGKTNEEEPLFVISKITTSRNEDGDEIKKVYGAYNGEMRTFVTDGEVLLKKESGTLKAGDIIRVRLNSSGEIEKFDLIFDIDAKNTEFSKTMGDKTELIYGKVARKFATSINVTVNGGDAHNYSLNGATVYSYENDKISVATTADIERFDENNPAKVLIRLYDNKVEEIVIVK
ncbi:MAG: S-layer homology domain-containing protein [Ruminococcaceae bacterium]|nr:S-layer homology domain-containing protein [Oscillospiraceae bacterium]